MWLLCVGSAVDGRKTGIAKTSRLAEGCDGVSYRRCWGDYIVEGQNADVKVAGNAGLVKRVATVVRNSSVVEDY